MTPARLRPFLTPVPVQARTEDGAPVELFQLRDPFKLAQPVGLPPAGLALAVLFDGQRTVEEIQAEFAARYGASPPPADQIAGLAEALEAALLLEGPALREHLEAFSRAPVRAPACIGSYPGEPAELRAFLEAQWHREGGPGAGPGPQNGAPRVRGVISPHIDLHRGGHAYAQAWRPVAEACSAELFVIFGTSHTGTSPVLDPDAGGPEPLYALTRKTFETPLGPVPVDQQVVDRLLAAYDGPDDLFAGEHHHRGEHSIEFQTVYLRHLFAERPGLRILPILCGGLHELSGAPSADPRFQAFHRALRVALADLAPSQVTFVAGIDLAHIGAQFDEPPVDGPTLDQVSSLDRETMRLAIEGRDPDLVHADIARGGNPRNICGHGALVGFLEALREAPVTGELIHYDRWYDGASSVTFAGAVYRETPEAT